MTSPAVTLSPKARNFVRVSCGTRCTLTSKAQVAVADAASVAVQVTRVGPTGKTSPDAGAQPTVAGARPPAGVGSE